MRHGATEAEVRRVIAVIEEMGYKARSMPGAQRTAVGLVGNDGRVDASRLEGLPGVQDVIHVTKPYKQVSRDWKAENTVVRLPGGVAVGGTDVVAIAGPCSVESERQIIDAARLVKEAGAVILRGGAWKPRTSPYAFQGLGRPGLKLLAKAREETGLLICTEAMDPEGVGYVAEVADIIQIGARNMQNSSLLKAAGRAKKAVLLKRGMAATIEELLLSAEYVLAEGNHDVILCERGIRGFDTATRNVFDLTAIPVVHKLSHLPIIADPSHGTGLRDKVIPMARAAVAAGADGIMVEVHPNPEQALSDGAQTLFPDQFAQLMREVRVIAEVIGRRVAEPAGVGRENGKRGTRKSERGTAEPTLVRMFRVPRSTFRASRDRALPRAPIPRPLAHPRPRQRDVPDDHQPLRRLRADHHKSDDRHARHDARPAVPDASESFCDAVHGAQGRSHRGGWSVPLAVHAEHHPRSGDPLPHPRIRHHGPESDRTVRGAAARALHGAVRPGRLASGRGGRGGGAGRRHPAGAEAARPTLQRSVDQAGSGGRAGAPRRYHGELRTRADGDSAKHPGERRGPRSRAHVFAPGRSTGGSSVGSVFKCSKPDSLLRICSSNQRSTILLRKRHSFPSFAAGIRFSCAHL